MRFRVEGLMILLQARNHISYSLTKLLSRDYSTVIKGDTRSLDYSSDEGLENAFAIDVELKLKP